MKKHLGVTIQWISETSDQFKLITQVWHWFEPVGLIHRKEQAHKSQSQSFMNWIILALEEPLMELNGSYENYLNSELEKKEPVLNKNQVLISNTKSE